jgi:hypothetical protein
MGPSEIASPGTIDEQASNKEERLVATGVIGSRASSIQLTSAPLSFALFSCFQRVPQTFSLLRFL